MDKEKLYEAFGEMIYVMAMADGVIQPEEIEVLNNIVRIHPWGKEIEWSFKYENSKKEDLEYLYNKVLDFCHSNGPQPEYKNLLEIMDEIAKAAEGVHPIEENVMRKFTSELTARFKRDLDIISKKSTP